MLLARGVVRVLRDTNSVSLLFAFPRVVLLESTSLQGERRGISLFLSDGKGYICQGAVSTREREIFIRIKVVTKRYSLVKAQSAPEKERFCPSSEGRSVNCIVALSDAPDGNRAKDPFAGW